MYIGNSTSIPSRIELAGDLVDVVSQFEYLGRVLSRDGTDTNCVEARINKGWIAFQKYKDLITSNRLSFSKKIHI